MLKVSYLITMLIMGSILAMAEEPNPSVLINHQVLYDGALKSTPAPYLRVIDEVARGEVHAVNCGHLIFSSKFRDRAAAYCLPESNDYSCRQTIIGLDFTNRAILTLVDLAKNAQSVKSGNRATYPVTRYLAKIKSQPVIFFEGISQVRITGDQKLDSLAKVIQRLADAGQTIGQDRYLDGTFTVEVAGPMKFDPENRGITYPNNLYGLSARRAEFGTRNPRQRGILLPDETGLKKITNRVISEGNLVKEYLKPTELFTALTQTLSILKSGYRDLKINSDANNQTQFKRLVTDNAEVIAKELKNAIQLMNQNNYHIMEMGWFVSQVGELIDAIDGILKSAIGSDPGLIEIIRETEQG